MGHKWGEKGLQDCDRNLSAPGRISRTLLLGWMLHNETFEARCGMVQLLRHAPVTAYELRDAGGQTIGQVIQPSGTPRTGLGAETVLLIRSPRPADHTEISSAA
jgi:hypothetical protein